MTAWTDSAARTRAGPTTTSIRRFNPEGSLFDLPPEAQCAMGYRDCAPTPPGGWEREHRDFLDMQELDFAYRLLTYDFSFVLLRPQEPFLTCADALPLLPGGQVVQRLPKPLPQHISQADHLPRGELARPPSMQRSHDAVQVITSSEHLPAAHQPDCARIKSISVPPRQAAFRVGTIRPAH
jgi:hypothetical protein